MQPKIRRLNRDVAAFLRSNPPSGIEQERVHRCLDAVESPWPRREENLLRLAWERELTTSGEKARHLVEEVERIGAEPFHSPDPLPPIAEEEIHLITWMAIERENAEAAAQLTLQRTGARVARSRPLSVNDGADVSRRPRSPHYGDRCAAI
ncbi:MAG: hypothetical protein HY953_09015 [Candidatus Rokubacteria bacterium]|nr:hypothetical protein [Candidatus Rokubacteria bacterium]